MLAQSFPFSSCLGAFGVHPKQFIRAIALAGTALILAGCGSSPSAENIRLRKINQGLQTQVDSLAAKTDAQQRTLDGLMKRSNTVATLPPDELKKLWIASGIKFGKLTGLSDLGSGKPGAQGLKAFVSTTDDSGHAIQAAGSFVVEAFDLAETGDTHLGRWTFDAAAAKSQWRSFLFEFGYELSCPWQKVPRHPDITIHVTFTDELSQIPYEAQTVVHIDLPALTAAGPKTSPSR